jgi:AcrR family transcriptional regulator
MTAAMIKEPKTRRGQETFSRLVRAGEKLFHEHTYHLASINDIVKEAGVGIGTFYLYFNSKHELFRYLVLSYHHDIRKTIAERTANATTRRDQERIGLRTFLDYVIRKPYAYTIIWQSLLIDRELFVYYYSTFAEKYVIQLQQSIKNGEVPSTIDPLTLAYFLMGVSNFLGLEIIVFAKKKFTEEEIERAVDSAMIVLEQGMFNNKHSSNE